MKTDKKTVGFGGGFTDARTVRPRCRATAVLPRDFGYRYRVVASNENARPVLQHRTGASNCAQQMTEDILTHMPRWKRCGVYAIVAGSVTGIIPLAAAELVADAFTGVLMALESLIGSGMMSALGIGLCIAAIIACMAYLFKLVIAW